MTTKPISDPALMVLNYPWISKWPTSLNSQACTINSYFNYMVLQEYYLHSCCCTKFRNHSGWCICSHSSLSHSCHRTLGLKCKSLSCAEQNKLSIRWGPKCKTGKFLHWYIKVGILSISVEPQRANLSRAQIYFINSQNASELQLKEYDARILKSPK